MIAYADPSLDAPTSLQDALRRLDEWQRKPGCVVHTERPDGRVFLAVAYENGDRVTPIAWGYGDTREFATEELAEAGAQARKW